MKKRTLLRLDMMAAEREMQLRESVRRHQAALRQSESHQGLLASYRDRLGESWRGGELVTAGFACRAGRFAQASHGAEIHITQAARQAAEQLSVAMEGLAEIQAQRRELREAIAQADRKARIAEELAIERDRPWRKFFQEEVLF